MKLGYNQCITSYVEFNLLFAVPSLSTTCIAKSSDSELLKTTVTGWDIVYLLIVYNDLLKDTVVTK